MNKLLLLFLFLLTFTLSAQDGIEFADGAWQKILRKAEKENKLIFLDAYTTWCGPCKMMTKDVFPDRALGKYYNENFVNVQLDMESEEGRPVAAEFKVLAYPSLLFINGKGNVVHRAVGYHGADQLLEVGKIANDPEQNLAGLLTRFKSGERDPDFLLKLAMTQSNAMDGRHMETLEAYFDTQKDWTTLENMELLFMLTDDIGSPLFKYLVDHRADFELMFGKKAVMNKLQQLVNQELYRAESESLSLEKVDQLYARVYPDMAEQLSARFRMDYFRMAGDLEKYLDATATYLEKFSSDDAMELNNAAWNFFEIAEDTEQLKLALGWARKSVDIDPAYYNYDTLASLYYKLGEKKKAVKIAKQAIQIAKSQGEDYGPTQALLEAIKGK